MMKNVAEKKFSNETTLDELHQFCDTLDCPNYTYTDVLKLHAYFVSKKEIQLEQATHYLTDDEQEEKDREFIGLNKNQPPLSDDSNTDQNIFDFSEESDQQGSSSSKPSSQSQKKSGPSSSRKKIWTDEEIECMIEYVNRHGCLWTKMLKEYKHIFVNKTRYNVRDKYKSMKNKPEYASRFHTK